MDKEFAEVFKEEIVNEGKIEELGKQIAGLADKFKEGKDDVMTMADEMITNGAMPDPEMIKMLETEEADMVIHLIAKKMGVQWTKDNGYGEMRFKQDYPESHIKKNADRLREMSNKIKEAMNPKDHVKEKDGKFEVIAPSGKVVYSSDDKKEAEEWAVKNHDALMKEEVGIDEAKMKPDMIDTLKKKYESLRGKRLSLGQNMEIAKIVSGMSRDKEVLIQLVKADIPFISLNAATLLMDKHGMKAKDINLAKEEVEVDESVEVDGRKKAYKEALKRAESRRAKVAEKKIEVELARNKWQPSEGIDIQKADMKDVIKDFKTSDAPQFKGKSDKKKKEMAIAAKLSKEENEDDDPVGKSKKKSKKDVINLKPTAESSMKKFKDIMTKLKEKRSSNEEVEMKEEWIDVEARKVEGLRWKKMSTKDRTKWLDRIKKMADKEGMSQEELDDILGKGEYGLTKFDDERVYNKAQLVKPKWKRMSTVQKTKWVDDLHDLAGKTNTSDADVESILDDAGLKIKESVEEASGDKEAYQKFFNGALKKFGVKSPSQLKGDKKKEFFDYVDKNWTADHEEETKKEETMTKKSLKDAVSNMKEKKSKVQEALTIGGVEVGEQDFDKQFRLDNAAPNLGMTYKDYQATFETDGMEGPYHIDGSAHFWDKAKAYWYSVEGKDYVDKKRNDELNFRYTKQGTAGGGLMHNRRF